MCEHKDVGITALAGPSGPALIEARRWRDVALTTMALSPGLRARPSLKRRLGNNARLRSGLSPGLRARPSLKPSTPCTMVRAPRLSPGLRARPSLKQHGGQLPVPQTTGELSPGLRARPSLKHDERAVVERHADPLAGPSGPALIEALTRASSTTRWTRRLSPGLRARPSLKRAFHGLHWLLMGHSRRAFGPGPH